MEERPMRRWNATALAVATALVASAGVATHLDAQITQLARKSIEEISQLTFGSLCEDRFVIRNDGAAPVTLEYKTFKGTEFTALRLDGRELVELESKSRDPLELWIGGKLVASAEKEGRSCRDVQGGASVAIAPLEVTSTRDRDRNRNDQRYNQFGMGVGFGSPFYDPWWGPYGGYGFGYRPYAGFYGVPIIIGGRGGRRR
jgi:hypothetical protein